MMFLLAQFAGKRKVLKLFFPKVVDTGVCAASVRQFNKVANELNNTVVLVLFQQIYLLRQARFACGGAEGLDNVLSRYQQCVVRNLKKNYGVAITSGPLAGLTSRAVIVLDEK